MSEERNKEIVKYINYHLKDSKITLSSRRKTISIIMEILQDKKDKVNSSDLALLGVLGIDYAIVEEIRKKIDKKGVFNEDGSVRSAITKTLIPLSNTIRLILKDLDVPKKKEEDWISPVDYIKEKIEEEEDG